MFELLIWYSMDQLLTPKYINPPHYSDEW